MPMFTGVTIHFDNMDDAPGCAVWRKGKVTINPNGEIDLENSDADAVGELRAQEEAIQNAVDRAVIHAGRLATVNATLTLASVASASEPQPSKAPTSETSGFDPDQPGAGVMT